MRGLIFNYLEDFVEENFGIETWNALIETSNLETEKGAYVRHESYPDSDLFSLVSTASKALKTPPEDILQSFGEAVLYFFKKDFPKYFESDITAKDFLLSIHCVIHVEVKRLFPDSSPPAFEYENPCENQLVMHYHSNRKLCHLLRGLLKGVSKVFDTEITLDEPLCMHKGAEHCQFILTFAKTAKVS
jgi:hypothetical protein